MILAIIQARMSSQRLPNKVMREIMGKPMIGYIFERLSYSKRIGRMMLATSTNPENDALCQYVSSLGYTAYRGSEDDVLDRFYRAALTYNPRAVLRITGDSPLVDPAICDDLIKAFEDKDVDYAAISKRYAEGVDCEIISFSALEKAHRSARKSSEREHVTAYIYNHPEEFNMHILDNRSDDSGYRFTVDEPSDLAAMEKILGALYKKDAPPFGVEEVKRFIDTHPEVAQLNSHIIRNEGYLKSLKGDM